MTSEQWKIIGEVLAAVVSITAIITFLFGIFRWLWRKTGSLCRAQLSQQESDCIREFDHLDASLECSGDAEREKLRTCEGLVKKEYLQEFFSSPSRTVVSFGLSDKGKETYKKLLLSSNSKLLKAIRLAKTIFPDKIASTSGVPESEVRKVILLMEDEGQLVPTKSDNRGTLFWTHGK